MNKSVIYLDEETPTLTKNSFKQLRKRALDSGLSKVRICTHESISDLLDEMFIYHAKDAYVRPHKHINKVESLTIIEGEVDAIFYDDESNIINVIRLGEGIEGHMYYRLPKPIYHSLFIRTTYAIFHEVTTGPLISEESVFAPWSPDENDTVGVAQFCKNQEEKISSFLQKTKDTIKE